MNALLRFVTRSLSLEPGKGAVLAWAFLYSFCLLARCHLIRPLRDAMNIAGGERFRHDTPHSSDRPETPLFTRRGAA